MSKFGRSVLVSLLIGAMVTTPVLAAPSVNDIKNEKQAAEREVNSLQSELESLLNKMNQLETDLINKGQDITKAEEDLAVAEEKEKEQYESMKLRIKYMYEEGDKTFVETILTSKDFSDLLNKAEYVKNVHSYDRKMLREYVETKQQIADLKSQLETEMKDMEQLQVQYSKEETALNTTLTEKQDEVANLDEQLQAAVEAAEKKRQEEERKRREEEERRQQQLQQQQAANNNRPSNNNSRPSNNGSSNTNSNTNNNTSSGTTTTKPVETPSVSAPASGNSATGRAIVSGAAAYLGVPYRWGGTSSSGVDCSGLVYLAHRAAGISVARTSGSLGAGGRAVSASEAMPGDVVCYSGHVGIYVGNGQMIHAPQPGQSVCYSSVNYAYHWFRRYW